MSIFAFIFIAGLIVKGIFILIESLIYRLSLQYQTNTTSRPINVEQVDFSLIKNTEMEIEGSITLKPLGKQTAS